MGVILQQLALVSDSTSVPTGDVMRVAAALQKQASRDLNPIWNISATVSGFEKLEDVPIGYWPMIIKDNIGFNAAGIHLDTDRQPFALISAASDIDTWSLTASHETLEMLVDPYGDRVIAGDSPKPGQGRVSFLVEICDPSESTEFAYTVNGVRVSDFYTPEYFNPVPAPGIRYSFVGAITQPRQVLRGGYLSWSDSATTHWWQAVWFNGSSVTFRDIGPLDQKAGSLRSQIDRITNKESAKSMESTGKSPTRVGLTAAVGHRSSESKAARWRKHIDQVLKTGAR